MPSTSADGPSRSMEWNRIKALPWRAPAVESPEAVRVLTEWLRVQTPGRLAGTPGRCQYCGLPLTGEQRCKAPIELRDAQARAILEITERGGGLGQLGVGSGKTLLATLLPTAFALEHGIRRAAILVPSALVAPVKRAIIQAREHGWRVLPNLERYVIGYGRLSVAGSEDLLPSLDIQLLICDEAHSLKAIKSARTRRFLRLFAKKCHFVGLSGTFLHRSPMDYAHLAKLGLGEENSPLPSGYMELKAWSAVVGAPKIDEEPLPPGALLGLGLPGQDVFEAFAYRVLGTPGIVSTKAASCDASIRARVLTPKLPEVLQKAIDSVLQDWEIPGGHVIADTMGLHRAVSQLSLGFYSRLVFPSGSDIDAYYDARRAWARFCREAYRKPSLKLDSELPVAQAVVLGTLPDPTGIHARWRETKARIIPQDDVVWLDKDHLPRLVEGWLKAGHGKGLIWTHWRPAGELLGESGMRYYPGGTDPERDAPFKSAVLSVMAHGTGRNLQFANRSLLLTQTPNALQLEQWAGRTHRMCQQEDEVFLDFYAPTDLAKEKLASARLHAGYLSTQLGQVQRLSMADWEE